MTNNQLTDAQISNATLIRLIRWADEHKSHYVAAALRELQERRKADSEPVAEVVSIYGDPEAFGEREIRPLVGIQQMPYGTKLYRHAQPDASHLSRICAESYQVVGALAEALRIFNDVGVIKALDNLSAKELIHDDVLPFSVPESAQPAPVVFDSIDTNLIEALRLVQCMLDDYRERNYGDAQDWIRHINTHMSDYTEAHGDDAYSVLHNLITAAPQSPGSDLATVPGKWIPVSERLPEEGGDMIVFTDGIVMSGVSYAKKKGFYIQALEYDDDEPVDSVTHWMPLPAAPQEVNHG